MNVLSVTCFFLVLHAFLIIKSMTPLLYKSFLPPLYLFVLINVILKITNNETIIMILSLLTLPLSPTNYHVVVGYDVLLLECFFLGFLLGIDFIEEIK